MNEDLKECIARAKSMRDAVLTGEIPVKVANAASAANGQIIQAFAIDLRERIFASEVEAAAAIQADRVMSRPSLVASPH